jgi:hypothetical protein
MDQETDIIKNNAEILQSISELIVVKVTTDKTKPLNTTWKQNQRRGRNITVYYKSFKIFQNLSIREQDYQTETGFVTLEYAAPCSLVGIDPSFR